MGPVIFFMFVFGFLGALIASKKQIHPLAGFALGGLLGLIGLIIMAAMPAPREEVPS